MRLRKPIENAATVGAAVMAAAFVGGLLSAAHAATTLTMSNWVPPTHYITTDILVPWAQKVEEATEGRVKIRTLPKPIGSPPQHFELARRGVADITWGNLTYEPDRFTSIWFAELPLGGTDAEASSVALWQAYEKHLKDQPPYNEVKMLGLGLLGGGIINHGSKDIVELEDLSNQKIRMGGPIQKRILEELGAIPVAAPATKAYELLESGVVDGSLHPRESVVNFRLEDELTHHTMIPGGLYDASFFLVMNSGKWERISPKDQAAIMSVSGESFSRLWGQSFNEQNNAAEAQLRAAGNKFSEPSEELVAKAAEIRSTMANEWIELAKTVGVKDPAALLADYEAFYKKLSAK